MVVKLVYVTDGGVIRHMIKSRHDQMERGGGGRGGLTDNEERKHPFGVKRKSQLEYSVEVT